MFELLKSLFSKGPAIDFAQLKRDGALVVDVRTNGEFASGHVRGSINIPVDQIGPNLHKLKDKTQAVITCCASGMRSASATSILKSKGYTNVVNGGSWTSLQKKLIA